MKQCSRCQGEKETTEFGVDRARKDGLNPWCNACRRDVREQSQGATRQKQKERSRAYVEWLTSLYGEQPCHDCGRVFSFHVMEFDHVRGSKRYSIGKMANHSRQRVLEELAKCEYVCCACHRIRTDERRPPATTRKVTAYREWLATRKASPCTDCGQAYSAVAMDFDHVRGEKVTQISDMWSHSRQKVLEELAKCELVCANCHKERTWRRIHGAPASAKHRACSSCGADVWGYEGSAAHVKCEACRKTPLKHRKGPDTEDLVSCRLCGLQRRRLGLHLKRTHGLTKEAYSEQFPDALVEAPGSRKKSEATKAKMAAAARDRWAREGEREAQSERLKESAPWRGKRLPVEHGKAISDGLLNSDKRIGRPPRKTDAGTSIGDDGHEA